MTKLTAAERRLMADLDLDKGDPERVKANESAADKRRESRATGVHSKPGTRKTAAQKAEEEIAARLHVTFDRIATACENRNDEEMAAIFREEAQSMSVGLVSLTRNVSALRPGLLMTLNLVEPIMAFGRLGRELLQRFMARRARKIAEYEAAQAEMQAHGNAGQPIYQQ